MIDVRDMATGVRITPTPSIVLVEAAQGEREMNAAFSIEKSTVDLTPISGSAAITVGVPVELTITARNGGNEIMRSGGIAWDVELEGPITLDAADQRLSRGVVTDNLDGTYTVAVTAIAGSGRYRLDVRPAGVASDSPSIAGTPTATAIFASSPDGSGLFDVQYTTVDGAGLTRANAGRRAEFTITARDAFAVPMPVGGVTVVATLSNANGAVPVIIVDNNDGTYTARYEVPANLPGEFDLSVEVEGQNVHSGTVKVAEVGTGELVLANTRLSGDYLNAVVDQPARIIVSLFDENSKPYVADNIPVQVALTGNGRTIDANVLANGDGTYEATFTIAQPGPYKLKVAVAGAELPRSPFNLVGVYSRPANPLMAVELPDQAPMLTVMDRLVYALNVQQRHILVSIAIH